MATRNRYELIIRLNDEGFGRRNIQGVANCHNESLGGESNHNGTVSGGSSHNESLGGESRLNGTVGVDSCLD